MGIDLGERRIGVAVSDASGLLARALEVLEVRGLSQQVQAIVRVVERLRQEDDEEVAAIVVGLPRRLDGTPNEQTERVLAFVTSLRQRVPQPVELQDERLTSVEAESRLALHDRDWRSRKKRLDAEAAAIILQDFLDNRPRSVEDAVSE